MLSDEGCVIIALRFFLSLDAKSLCMMHIAQTAKALFFERRIDLLSILSSLGKLEYL